MAAQKCYLTCRFQYVLMSKCMYTTDELLAFCNIMKLLLCMRARFHYVAGSIMSRVTLDNMHQ